MSTSSTRLPCAAHSQASIRETELLPSLGVVEVTVSVRSSRPIAANSMFSASFRMLSCVCSETHWSRLLSLDLCFLRKASISFL